MGVSVRMIYFGIPKKPKYRRMNLWEHSVSAIATGYKCVICGRAEPFVRRWEAEAFAGRFVCERCVKMNEPFYECRRRWAQELWASKCPE